MNRRYLQDNPAAPSRRTLCVALALGLGFTGLAFGQATSGTLFGNAQAAAGQSVKVSGASGVVRTAAVGSDGRYSVGNLPIGSYTVTRIDGDHRRQRRREVAVDRVLLQRNVVNHVSFRRGAERVRREQ